MAEKKGKKIATAKLSDGELERYFWAVYDASRERFRGKDDPVSPTFKKRFSRNFAAYGSNFLSKAEREYLISTDRPPVEINLLTAKINAVLGSVAASQMEAQFKPHADSETANVLASWMTLLVRKAMLDCQGYWHQSEAFRNDLLTGYGAVEVYLDTSREPFRGVLRQVRLHELWPDPDAMDFNLSDRSFDLRVRKWLAEQVIARWTDKEEEIQAHVVRYGSFTAGSSSTSLHATGKAGGRNWRADLMRGKVEVAQLIYQRWMERVRWYDPERQIRRDTLPSELDERRRELEKALDSNGQPLYEPIEEDRYRGETWFRAHVLLGGVSSENGKRGIVILDHEESPLQGSTIRWVTGLPREDPDKEQVEFFNILDVAYGQQMVLNRVLQEELAILAREAKGGNYYTDRAVPEEYPGGEEQWLKDHSKPGANTKIAEDGWDQFKQKELPRIPAGLDRLEEKFIGWIDKAIAVSDAFVGSVQQERSARYLANLQQQGLVTLGPVLGPYTAFIKDCGRVMVELLIRHLPVADINRLLDNPECEGLTHERGEDGGLAPIMVDDPDAPVFDPLTGEQAFDEETNEPLYEQIPVTAGHLLKKENPLSYDVNVDAGTATISLRYAIWEMVEQGILQTLENALPAPAFRRFLMFMIRYLPVPGEQGATLAKDIERAIEQDDELQTIDGIKAFLLKMGPEQALPALQEVAQQLQQMMPPGDGGTPQGPPEDMGDMGEGEPVQ